MIITYDISRLKTGNGGSEKIKIKNKISKSLKVAVKFFNDFIKIIPKSLAES